MKNHLSINNFIRSPNASHRSLFINEKSTQNPSGVSSTVQTPSGLKSSLMTSDVLNKLFPTSPRVPAITFASTEEDNTNRTHRSHRLMRKISTFVQNPSKDFGLKIQTINSIETRKISSSQSHRPVTLSRTTSPNNKLTNYDPFAGFFSAKSGDTQNKDEITLLERKYTSVVFEPQKFLYFQIDCARFPSPLIINILRGPKTPAHSKVKVYVSKQNKRPSALSCDYTIESRTIKIFEKDYKTTFQTPTYYFGIYSEDRFEAKITYYFGEDQKGVKRGKSNSMSLMMKPDWKTRAKHTEYINMEEIKQIKREVRRKKWLSIGGNNVIEQNMRIPSASQKEQETALKKMLRESRSAEIRTNHSKREEIKLGRKIFLAERHNLVKTMRENTEKEWQQKMSKFIKERDWIQGITFISLMHHLKNIHKRKREAYRKRQKIFLKFHFIVLQYRKNILKKGDSLFERFVFDIRGSLELYARSLLLTRMEERDNILHKFFLEYALCSNAVRHVLITHGRARKYTDRWLLYKKKKMMYQKLFGLLWDKYSQSIVNELPPDSETRMTIVRSLEKDLTPTSFPNPKASISKKLLELKRPKFIKYMMDYNLLKFNNNYRRFRISYEGLEPSLRKTADYAKFFLLDRKRIMKNYFIAKMENLDFNGLFTQDISFADNVFQLYHKIDLIRPPRLYCIPKFNTIHKGIIFVARGEEKASSLDSLTEIE